MALKVAVQLLSIQLIQIWQDQMQKKTYSIPYRSKTEIKKEIKKRLKANILRPSKSKWCLEIVPVQKKDGSLCMCIDYRWLNGVIVKDKYSLSKIDDVIDAVATVKYFNTLDATSRYYQFEIKKEKDKCKTAFRFKNKFYEYNRMPFGLCNV